MNYLNDTMIDMAEGGVILDIGANVGMYFDHMSIKATKVYAFEPHPSNVNILISKAKNFNNVEVVACAINDYDGEVNLYQCSRNAGQHTLSKDIAVDPRWGHSIQDFIPTRSLTLDSWVKENNVTGITGIKIDVEGAEEFVFRGGLNTLMNNDVIISLETHYPINEDVIDGLVKRCGFKFWNGDLKEESFIKPDRQYIMSKKDIF